MRLLLFKLMLQSGLVKLMSGDPSWRGLTALQYHSLVPASAHAARVVGVTAFPRSSTNSPARRYSPSSSARRG